MIATGGWGDPAAAAVLSRWPQLVGSAAAARWTAVAFDSDTGALTLATESSTSTFMGRMIGRHLIDRINSALGSPTVRTVRVLRPPVYEPVAVRPPAPPADRDLQRTLNRQDSVIPREPAHVVTAGLGRMEPPQPADAVRARAQARACRERAKRT
jgi:hypothetical protein